MYFIATRDVVMAAMAGGTEQRYVPLTLAETGARMTAVDVVKGIRQDGPSAYSFTRRVALGLGALRQAWTARSRKSR
jgi:hypothetical protein